MAQLTKVKKGDIKRILTRHLSLKEPVFRLESAGGRMIGDIISTSFKGQRDHERQQRIWDALEAELGAEAVRAVGMLLAFTPEEWDLGADESPGWNGRKS